MTLYVNRSHVAKSNYENSHQYKKPSLPCMLDHKVKFTFSLLREPIAMDCLMSQASGNSARGTDGVRDTIFHNWIISLRSA